MNRQVIKNRIRKILAYTFTAILFLLISSFLVLQMPPVQNRLISHYLTFGEYDFLVVAEVPNDVQMAAVLLAAGSGGGVTDLRTTVALTSVEAKGAFAAAGDLAPGFKSAGGT